MEEPKEPVCIDPTIDCVFKKLLGTKENEKLTLHFLNAALGLKGSKRLTEIVFDNTQVGPLFMDGKYSIVDILLRDLEGSNYQVDIQNFLNRFQGPRMLHNWTTFFSSGLDSGEQYHKGKRVVSIWIMGSYFLKPEVTRAVGLKYRMHCPEVGDTICPDSFIQVYQLPNLGKDDSINEDLALWLRIFREGKDIDPNNPPEWAREGIAAEVMKVLQGFANNQNEFVTYMRRERAYRETVGLEKTLAEFEQENFAARQAEAKARQAEAKARQAADRARRTANKARREKEAAFLSKERERQEKERERQEKERERQEKERERLAKEAALMAEAKARMAEEKALRELKVMAEELERLRAQHPPRGDD